MKQILLVDDSQSTRKYVARTLEMTGLELNIREASNGREAIDKAREIHPDLIITDLNMPEMSGDQLVEWVASNPGFCGTPILILSADHSAGRPEELMHVGAVGYLTKPVTPERLRKRLLSMIAGPAGGGAK